jgi:hypothetical protein
MVLARGFGLEGQEIRMSGRIRMLVGMGVALMLTAAGANAAGRLARPSMIIRVDSSLG